MTAVVRDRGARSRIRKYLALHGSIEDVAGRATSVLMEAINYQGSSVAFLQLVAAMDRDGEINREIHGGRTFKISSASAPSNLPVPDHLVNSPTRSAHRTTTLEPDCDETARAVLRESAPRVDITEFWAHTDRSLESVFEERDRLRDERDEYAVRLEDARRQLDAILGEYTDVLGAAIACGGIGSATPAPVEEAPVRKASRPEVAGHGVVDTGTRG